MNEINRLLKRASWRLLLVDILRTLTLTATAALVLLLIARVANAFAAVDPEWTTVFIGAGGAAVVGAVVWSLATRPRPISVARTVDERADLRESLSTALWVSRSPDPWAAAVLETARGKAVGVNVQRAIPVSAPRLLPMPIGAATALLIVWFSIPEHFSFTPAARAHEAKRQLVEARGEVAQKEQVVAEALKKAGIDPEKEEDQGKEEAAPPATPEEVKREALKRMSRLQERVEQTTAEKNQQMEAMKELMKQLKQPGPGPLDEFSRAMARGDFQKAQEKLEELKKKLAEPNGLDEKQKQQLQSQLQKLSEQMKELAENTGKLQKELEQAGLSPEQAKQLAADPKALDRALENMKNLSDAQKRALMDAAKSASEACKNCNGMGESMSQMAQSLSEMGLSQEGMENLESLGSQLGDLEMLQADLAALDAAARACEAQLAALGQGMCEGGGKPGEGLCQGVGEWSEGDSSKSGGGTGGPGRSGGGVGTPEEEAAFNLRKEKAPTRQHAGPTIGERLVYGNAIRGDSVAEFSAAVAVHGQNAAEQVDTMDVPPEYRDAVKRYYGRLQKRADAAAGKPAQPEGAAPDATDAAPGK